MRQFGVVLRQVSQFLVPSQQTKNRMLKSNRRKFLASAFFLGIAGKIFGQDKQKPKADKTMIVHHVFFWLKNAGNEADRAKLLEGLRTLAAIKHVSKLQVGIPASTEKREVVDNSYDVSELMYFESLEAQAAYQKDPIHLKFVENYSHLWAKVVVYDMNVVS